MHLAWVRAEPQQAQGSNGKRNKKTPGERQALRRITDDQTPLQGHILSLRALLPLPDSPLSAPKSRQPYLKQGQPLLKHSSVSRASPPVLFTTATSTFASTTLIALLLLEQRAVA